MPDVPAVRITANVVEAGLDEVVSALEVLTTAVEASTSQLVDNTGALALLHADLVDLNSNFPDVLAAIAALANQITSIIGLLGAGLPASLSSGGVKVKLL